MPDVVAIVVAAGRGERFGAGPAKQYRALGGAPVLARALRPFETVQDVRATVLVVAPGDEAGARERVVEAHGLAKVACVVAGGRTRRESVARGIEAAPPCEIVLVHDASRPLADADLVRRVVAAAATHGAAVPVVAPRDTVKRGGADGLLRTLDRSTLWLAQTPQGFRADLLRRAHAEAGDDATDDAQLVERLGHPVAAVPGDERNLKITFPRDLVIAEALLHDGGA